MVNTESNERAAKNLFDLGKIGWDDKNGLTRIAYSKEYTEARDVLQKMMRDAGLDVRTDRVGNLFGRLEGRTERTILSGSHLDSVYGGGIYDGALGIVSALEAITKIKESGEAPKHSLEVAAFIGEESEPLGGTFGSRVFSGSELDEYEEKKLASFGITSEDVLLSRCVRDRYSCFLELHIEQGPYLERENISIGIPTGIVGITRLEITVGGIANHAGTTPMDERHDAVRSAAKFISAWFDWMDTQSDLVCNVGTISVSPSHVSIVPSGVVFSLE
ncbi:MAG: hydantoinase/carbamoylase family amidase, partial [Synergistaceae bacterium]